MTHAHSNSDSLGKIQQITVGSGSIAARGQGRLAIVLGLTTSYMLAEVVGGLVTGSLALLADAGHMLTDVFGLTMALIAIRFAQRPATPAKTYGFYRTEILAALVNSVVLFAIAGYILYEAWRRFQEPPVVQSLPMIGIAVGGLVVNLIGLKLLHAGAGESLNMQGAFLEVLSDLLASLGVILAGIIIYTTGWLPADPLISAVIGLFILPRSLRLLKQALDVLMEATPAHISTEAIEAALRDVPGVNSIHDLHVWTITSGFVAMTAHVVSDGPESSELLHQLRPLLRDRFGIEHLTLQVDGPDHADDGACCNMDPRCLLIEQPPLTSQQQASKED